MIKTRVPQRTGPIDQNLAALMTPVATAEPSLESFPIGFQAIVIGSSGAIGAAVLQLLAANPRCGRVVGLHRGSVPPIDFNEPQSIDVAAQTLAGGGPFHLIINATGSLHGDGYMPEKRLADLAADRMVQSFQINAIGPALVIKQFARLMAPDRAVFALLSAKVGSISDNRLGGWYSYRASKAALNMLIKTAAIELTRSNRNSVLVAFHPGTVASRLSQAGLETMSGPGRIVRF